MIIIFTIFVLVSGGTFLVLQRSMVRAVFGVLHDWHGLHLEQARRLEPLVAVQHNKFIRPLLTLHSQRAMLPEPIGSYRIHEVVQLLLGDGAWVIRQTNQLRGLYVSDR